MRTAIQTHRPRRAVRAFTLMEIMIIASAVGIMVMIAMPNFLKDRATTQQRACRKKLHLLFQTKQQWGAEHQKAATVTPTAAQLREYFGKAGLPICPSRGTYTLRPLNQAPTCSRAALGHTY